MLDHTSVYFSNVPQLCEDETSLYPDFYTAGYVVSMDLLQFPASGVRCFSGGIVSSQFSGITAFILCLVFVEVHLGA